MKKIVKTIILFVLLLFFVICALRITCFLYPLGHKLTVEKFCDMYDVSEDLVYAVIKAESNFDESAVSKKGAIGLMQITEDTGRWAAEKMGKEEFSKELLYDPVINIQIGCFYLSYLSDLYEGNIENTLAAYNAGPSNVDKWLKDELYSQDGKKLSKIPFRETSNYVRTVKLNAKIYDFLY